MHLSLATLQIILIRNVEKPPRRESTRLRCSPLNADVFGLGVAYLSGNTWGRRRAPRPEPRPTAHRLAWRVGP